MAHVVLSRRAAASAVLGTSGLVSGLVLSLALTGCTSSGSRPVTPSAGPSTAVSLVAVPSASAASKTTPQDYLARAQSALTAASSVRVVGTIINQGQRITVDVRVTQTSGAVGTVTLSQGKLELVRIGQTAYVKASAATWDALTKNPAVGKAVGGKWVKGSATSGPFAQLFLLTRATDIAAELLRPDGSLSTVPGADLRGMRTIGLKDSRDGGVLYVAAADPGYPMAAVPKDAAAGRIDFTEYGQPVTVAPPSGPVVTLKGL